MKTSEKLKEPRVTAALRIVEEATPVQRVPWRGGLDDKELARPGGMLLAALYQCAVERGELLQDMAKELGVTYGYLSQLRGGLRSVNTISDDFAAACAAYLGLNRFQVLMMAGRLTPADLWDNPVDYEKDVRDAMAAISRDDEYKGSFTHELFNKIGADSQYAIVRLYEKATNKVLLKEGVDPKKIARHVKSVQSLGVKKETVFKEK